MEPGFYLHLARTFDTLVDLGGHLVARVWTLAFLPMIWYGAAVLAAAARCHKPLSQ